MINHIRFLLSSFFLFISCALFAAQDNALFTYFHYSDQDIQTLKQFQSDFHITKKDLKKWDQLITETFKEAPASLAKLRLFTYLYVAQNDAAALSFRAKGNFAGSLDSLSYALIALFLPEYKKPADFKPNLPPMNGSDSNSFPLEARKNKGAIFENMAPLFSEPLVRASREKITSNMTAFIGGKLGFNEDDYSIALKKIVFEKIRERKEEEDARQVSFQIPKEFKSDFVIGQDVAKWLPWYTIPATAYLAPPPPTDDKVWDQQIKEIRKMQDPITEKKKQTIYLWAGMTGFEKSDWSALANDYLFSHNIPLKKLLQVRFVLSMGLYDAFIVSFESKYKYLVIRPSMRDPTLYVEIPVPKHPSYPSNHSVISSLSAVILSYFFPSDSSCWNRLANESGLSRIWGGIHYPIDDQAGRQVGKKIGDNLLEKLFTSSSK